MCPPGTQAIRGPLNLVDAVTELATAIVPFALMWQALARRAPEDWRTAIVLATAISLGRLYGLAVSVAGWSASGFPPPTGTVYDLGTYLYVRGDVAIFVVAAAVALARSTSLDAPRRRAAFGFAATVLVTIALGFLVTLGIPGPEWSATRSLIGGVFLFLVPLIVAYAMLRHQILGLDLRVRWTIRRGTVAAVFVGVFIVATQVAQNVFSASYGMLWGGVITGLLLVGVAPMQRVAERLADAAAPEMAKKAPRSEKEAAYRNALRLALRDRKLTRGEEVQLAHLAEQLGIGAMRAMELRHEVEDAELPEGPPGGPKRD